MSGSPNQYQQIKEPSVSKPREVRGARHELQRAKTHVPQIAGQSWSHGGHPASVAPTLPPKLGATPPLGPNFAEISVLKKDALATDKRAVEHRDQVINAMVETLQRRSIDDVLALLRKCTPGERVAMDGFIQHATGETMRSIIARRYATGEAMVRVFAILDRGQDKGAHVELALTLLVHDVVDSSEILKVLKGMKLAATRRAMKEDFNRAFQEFPHAPANDLLADYIRGELVTHFNDVQAQQALALFERDKLTNADTLYEAAVGTSGTHTNKVHEVLNSVMKEGYRAFRQLDLDWAHDIKEKGWSKYYLYDALKGELDTVFARSEGWNITKAYLQAYEEVKRRVGAGNPSASEECDMQIEAAQAALEAARGRISWTTNDEAVVKAAQLLSQAWEKKIAKEPDEERRNDLRAEWMKTQNWLLANHIGVAERHVFALRAAATNVQSPADKVHELAQFGRYDEVVNEVTKIWASGKIDEFKKDLTTPVVRHDEPKDVHAVRLGLGVSNLIPTGSSDPRYKRVESLLNPGFRTDAQRGGNRIAAELEVHDWAFDRWNPGDPDLADLVLFFKTDGLSSTLRDGSVAAFMAKADNYKLSDANVWFLQKIQIQQDHENGPNFHELVRMLAPAEKGYYAKLIQRAELQEKAANGGLLSSGKRRRVAQQKLDTLRFIANPDNARMEPAYGILLEQSEAPRNASQEDRIEHAVGHYQEQFAAATAASLEEQKELAGMISGIMQTAVELGFGLATGGVGWGAVLASGGSLFIGYATKKLLLGSSTKVFSNEHAKELISSVASSIVDEFVDVRKRIEAVAQFESTKWFESMIARGKENRAKEIYNSVQNLGAGIAEGAANAMLNLSLDMVLLQKDPTYETMTAEFAKYGAQAVGRFLHSYAGTAHHNPGVLTNDALKFKDRLATNFKFKELVKIFEGTSKKFAETVLTVGGSEMSWQEILEKVGVAQLKSIFITVGLKSYASAKGQDRRARARTEQAELIERTYPGTRKRVIDAFEHSPDVHHKHLTHTFNKWAAREEPHDTVRAYIEAKMGTKINEEIIKAYEGRGRAREHDIMLGLDDGSSVPGNTPTTLAAATAFLGPGVSR